MAKCIKRKSSSAIYRTDNRTAKALVKSGAWTYTTKEAWKRQGAAYLPGSVAAAS